jgi:RNase P/RNase MRP subunit p29
MRTPSFFTAVALAGALIVTAACDRGTTGPGAAELSTAELSTLAPQFDALAFAMASFVVPQTLDREFSHTRACPKGGSTTLAGRVTGEADRETRTRTSEMKATKTDQNCSFEVDRRGATVTVNGNPNIVLQHNMKIVNGVPSGLQTSSQKGAFTWQRSDGASGSCTVDVRSVFDPDAKTHTVSGTMCDRQINVVRGRP